jgi:aspartyl protease family protein
MSEHQQSKSIGKGMIIMAWIMVLGLLTLFFNNLLDKQHNPNSELQSRQDASGTREVQLLRNRAGHYVATGEINQSRVIFFLDTGATTISIPGGVASQLGLKKGHAMNVQTANGTVQVYSTQLKQVKLGDIELFDVNANINPHMQGDEILLGMNVLKKLELVQKGNTLTIRQY